jgi:hypothetical protein
MRLRARWDALRDSLIFNFGWDWGSTGSVLQRPSRQRANGLRLWRKGLRTQYSHS